MSAFQFTRDNFMPVEILQSTEVYKGRVFSVHRDRVRLPNGVITPLDILHHQGAVVIVPVDADGHLVMIRQYRHAARRDLLEFPAGGLEPGEDPAACALRELREEIGMGATSIEPLGGFFLAPGYSTEYLHVFRASGLYPAPLSGDEDELIETVTFSSPEALKMAASGEIEDAKTLASLLLIHQGTA